MQIERVSGPTVLVPEAVFAKAYQEAIRAAERKARKLPSAADALIDAATSAILWARDHCTDAGTFPGFAAAAVRQFLHRCTAKARAKLARRPDNEPLREGTHTARAAKPVKPLLIDELPEDLAFVARLYTVDGYTVREIGLLTGVGHSTAALQLQKAAELLAAGRIATPRRKGEKRLTAG